MDHLDALRRELASFGATLDGDPAAPVAHCGDWTLTDLAVHVGTGNLWVATAVREGHGRDHDESAAPRDPAALRAWYEHSADALLTALSAAPDTPAWTFTPPHTVGFWRRRRAQETLVHRWDAEHALGRRTPVDSALAADGVAEVLDVLAPLMVARGAAPAPERAVRITAVDAARSWTHGPGDPVAELSGTAEDLLLTLWGRLPRDTPSLSWTGDRAAGLAALAGPLVP
ncbi:maleylpyruvate isomerase family mycothiol-dependent enzyme (plasmid) [Streptomyces sp. BI20]|uniref:maleylpyruvate isomerase family mycothiol-dependent enzyme n=1 Tax=Streptomyces sp. BI20 TaxID=3403460 RepID=UPI003C796741